MTPACSAAAAQRKLPRARGASVRPASSASAPEDLSLSFRASLKAMNGVEVPSPLGKDEELARARPMPRPQGAGPRVARGLRPDHGAELVVREARVVSMVQLGRGPARRGASPGSARDLGCGHGRSGNGHIQKRHSIHIGVKRPYLYYIVLYKVASALYSIITVITV